ncbi:MAG: DUF72 domain-containing protein [Chloroflexia bacterium]
MVGRRGACHIGTSGWVYPHWRGIFYPPELPQRAWFAYYARHFSTVEVNNTFYRLPDEPVFRSWCEQAPPGFRYALKVHRLITHMKKLRGAEAPLQLFLDRACLLGDRLGPLLYQLPPGWACDTDRLAAFLEMLPQGLLHVFEFRHPSWFCPETLALLERYGAVLCLLSMPGVTCPIRVTGPAVYLRLHGSTTLYASRYSREELSQWAEVLAPFLQQGLDVYVYFNNDAFGYAVANAQELRALLAGRGADEDERL